MLSKTCTRCGETKPASHDYFGSTPSGNLRGYCNACMNKASREYEANNKDRRRARDAKRAQAANGARRAFSLETKRDLWRKQSCICLCCLQRIERPEDGEVDHVTPLSKGGRHEPSNFLLAHSRCNRDKHNKTLIEHWEWRGRVGLGTEKLGRKHGP